MIWRVLISIFLLLSNASYACDFQIENNSVSQTINERTLKTINVHFQSNGNWKLFITPLENKIAHSFNSDNCLELGRISLEDINDSNDITFKQNQSCLVAKGNDIGMLNIPITFKILNKKGDLPGTYSIPLKVTLAINNSELEKIYPLNFTQKTIHQITANTSNVDIKIGLQESCRQGDYHYLKQNASLKVLSNTKWKLFIKYNNTSNDYKNEFKISTNSDSIKSDFKSEFYPLIEKQFLIAQGNPTINNLSGELKPELIEINYRTKYLKGKNLLEGKHKYNIEFILIEDEPN